MTYFTVAAMLTNAASAPFPTGDTANEFLQRIETIRRSGVLGRSRLMQRLFDFLAEASHAGRAPKESEIAYSVFDKPADFASDADAAVRVYIHRLRRKLDDYARDHGRPGEARLALARGEYRLVLIGPAVSGRSPAVEPPRRTWAVRVAVAALALLALAGWGFGGQLRERLSDDGAVRASAVWAPFAASRFPVLIVVGDYFIFGESDDGMEVNRLVREYSVNSTEDLDAFLMQHPEKAARYVDLGLSYLPTSSAMAVSRLTRVFESRRSVRVVRATQVTPQMLKTYDIVYVGYLSGLGPLRATLLSGSRYEPGDSYDELIDVRTHRRFVSQAALGPVRGGAYRDYGYVSVFEGPVGNHIAVVAGARDVGALAAAEQVTSRAGLADLRPVAEGRHAFEAVYEVQGEGDVNLKARIAALTPRDAPGAWGAAAR